MRELRWKNQKVDRVAFKQHFFPGPHTYVEHVPYAQVNLKREEVVKLPPLCVYEVGKSKEALKKIKKQSASVDREAFQKMFEERVNMADGSVSLHLTATGAKWKYFQQNDKIHAGWKVGYIVQMRVDDETVENHRSKRVITHTEQLLKILEEDADKRNKIGLSFAERFEGLTRYEYRLKKSIDKHGIGAGQRIMAVDGRPLAIHPLYGTNDYKAIFGLDQKPVRTPVLKVRKSSKQLDFQRSQSGKRVRDKIRKHRNKYITLHMVDEKLDKYAEGKIKSTFSDLDQIKYAFKFLTLEKLLKIFGVDAYTPESVSAAIQRVQNTYISEESINELVASHPKNVDAKKNGKESAHLESTIRQVIKLFSHDLERDEPRFTAANMQANYPAYMEGVLHLHTLAKNPASFESVLAKTDQLLDVMDQLYSFRKFYDESVLNEGFQYRDTPAWRNAVLRGLADTEYLIYELYSMGYNVHQNYVISKGKNDSLLDRRVREMRDDKSGSYSQFVFSLKVIDEQKADQKVIKEVAKGLVLPRWRVDLLETYMLDEADPHVKLISDAQVRNSNSVLMFFGVPLRSWVRGVSAWGYFRVVVSSSFGCFGDYFIIFAPD